MMSRVAPLTPRLTTYTGRWVNPLALDPADIDIRDVAHALALLNRFGGHTKEPISVAQHSVFVSRLVPPEYALQGLLHDGSEAYLCDIPKWVKHSAPLAGYREIEAAAQRAVYRAYRLPEQTAAAVEMADRLMVRYEGTEGYDAGWLVGHPAYPPLTAEERAMVGQWWPWHWSTAEREFLSRFQQLTGG